jgi:carbon storage regulator
MLVLTRRQGEAIVIGQGIKVVVVSLGPNRVKLGIEAPPEVRIDREEIHNRLTQEQHAPDQSDVLAAVAASTAETTDTGANTTVLSKTAVLALSRRQPR